MHYSGILVQAEPGATDRCAAALDGLPGVEVHFLYPESGRIIVVQETENARGQEDGLRRIQTMEGVRSAALVEHRIEEESAPGRGGSS